MSWTVIILLIVGAALSVALLSLVLGSRESWDLEETPERFRALQRAYGRALRTLKDLEFDHQAGTLSEEEHTQLKAEYKEKAISIRRAMERSRLAAVRRIAKGESASSSGDDLELVENLVARVKESYREQSEK